MSDIFITRDIDIRIASEIATDVSRGGHDTFVLTGSYSIDALTGADVTHNDIDANIFATDISTSLGRISLILESQHDKLFLTKHTDSRLEYLYLHSHGSSQVELQFVEYVEALHHDNGIDFILPGNSGQKIIVPVIPRIISETNGNKHEFFVKSLPYAIGTWALRISGMVMNQKREIRQSDIDHFAYLVQAPHSKKDVINAILHHPQMLTGNNPETILDRALDLLNKEADDE